ncbi:TonB-dependent hemoglobin/transferrin/lactoferrin family receptor [Vibrio genomosp. F10 str. 9ZC157]|uniref:TonB-dependent receptor n=1 Tax=Vibrio genomosp. F10 str. ZF-129 TaxID=1187848 RepID=A0A1E5B9X5_9VIBR|nr:TonB-dependent hemoglobin/transferrin/lactoferrin family receptor [Vibrio genomosp. F10]OEE30718.1 TonB-dependent receptor [Vibrio genomosp. F10 str. ZF-129]OEE94025.1 TonB-dependent receptor [Vibrio genomosp. F10 str. 9ZC157]
MLNKKPLAVVVAAILSSNSAVALAQDEVFTLDQVVVSSTRTNQTIQDTAASVTVISDQEIEENLANSVDDLFSYTPGVDVQSDSRQGIQSINIRGMEGNRIKILVDGVSQPNQFKNVSSFINSGRVDVDIDMIKSVEVVKGAASSLQGSDAIGGIVAFETKDPIDFLADGKDVGGHAKFNFSSADNTFSESVALANRFGDLETLVAYTRRDGEEIDNFGHVDPQSSDANNVLLKLQYQLNQAHRLEFTGEYVNSTIKTQFSDDLYTDYSGEDISDRYRIGLKHIWAMESLAADKLTWQLDYQVKDQNGITDRTFASRSRGYTPGNVQKKDYVYSDEGIQADIQLDKFFEVGSTEHFVVYGASFSNKDIANTNSEYNSLNADQVVFYMPEASETRYGFFAQDEITMGNLILTPGVRFDSFETDPGNNFPEGGMYDPTLYKAYSDSAVTGRLGALYSLNQENKIFAQVSQGFRAPDFQELFYSFGNPMHGYASIPNPDLEAEESVSYELGWRHDTAMSSTEVAVFYSDYDNFIDYQNTGMNGRVAEYQYVNINQATIKGVEFANTLDWYELTGRAEGVSTRVAAAYTEGKDGNKDPLNSVNPWNAVLGLNYDAPSNVWGSSLKVTYTAKKKQSDVTAETNRMGQPSEMFTPNSSTVVDLTAYYVPMKDVTLRAGIFNATDEEYYNWSDVRGQTEEDKFYTQAGRSFAITAKYDF